MQSYLLGRLAVLLGIFAAAVNAQGVTADISPPTKAPTGCQTSFPGTFEVTVIPAKLAKRDGDSVLSLQVSGPDNVTSIFLLSPSFIFGGLGQASADSRTLLIYQTRRPPKYRSSLLNKPAIY